MAWPSCFIFAMQKQHDMEKSKFIQQLSQAKEQLDQAMEEKAISIAEAKQQMHLELEERDQKNSNMQENVRSLTSEKGVLETKLEKSDKRGVWIFTLEIGIEKLSQPFCILRANPYPCLHTVCLPWKYLVIVLK